MNQKQIVTGVVGVLLGIAIGYALFYTPPPAAPITDQSSSMHDAMHAMNAGLEGKTGDAFDQAFLSEMIVHHEGAVAMAEAALEHASHKELKNMAEAIISAQTNEIAQMKEWLKNWYGQ